MNVGEWYRNNYGMIIFWVIMPLLILVGFIKLCAHVDLIDPGLVYENIKEEQAKEAENNGEPWTDNEGFHHNI